MLFVVGWCVVLCGGLRFVVVFVFWLKFVVVRWLFSFVGCRWFVVCGLVLRVVRCWLLVDCFCYLLFVVLFFPSVAFVVRCLLFDDCRFVVLFVLECCLLCVVCCLLVGCLLLFVWCCLLLGVVCRCCSSLDGVRGCLLFLEWRLLFVVFACYRVCGMVFLFVSR